MHTHGAPEKQAASLLGDGGRALHARADHPLQRRRRWLLHYVTAREMYNIAIAAMDGQDRRSGRVPRLRAAAAARGHGLTRTDATPSTRLDDRATPRRPTSVPTILYFGNDWMAENRTSSHHVARWLAKRYRVIYVESPGLRAPKGTGRDLKKLCPRCALALRGPRSTPEGLSVQTLLQMPLHRFTIVRARQPSSDAATLKLLMRSTGSRSRSPGSWCPTWRRWRALWASELSVYYCIDDYASLPDVDPVAVRAMDDELTRKADLVFVASGTLLERQARAEPQHARQPARRRLRSLRQGAGPGAGAVPPTSPSLPRPSIGFFGLIERWIELDLVG